MEKLKHKILIASEQKDIREKLEPALKNEGHEVLFVANLLDLFKKTEEVEISLILLDLNLFGVKVGNLGENPFLILRDCCGQIELTRNHLKGNIELLFFKQSEIEDMIKKINSLLKKLDPFIYKKKRLQEIEGSHYFEEIIGNSNRIKEIYHFINKVAKKRIDVLIMGETGTGKELVARAIHNMSSDVNRAFVSLNCAAIPATLIESEIFGHEKGAFTGAIKRHIGRLELADGGTLFLDEIGDMSLEMQAKLLRAIESKEFTRVGGEEPIHFNIRIISATNKDLSEDVDKGRFRNDLFYRINVDSFTLPTLRDRKEDIPLLVDYFIRRYGREMSSKVHCISPEALSILLKYSWPGNIRELKNCIQRAITYCNNDGILTEHLPAYLLKYEGSGDKNSLTESIEKLVQESHIAELPNNLLKSIEAQLIPEILKKTGCNQKMTAALLGLSINTLKSRLKEYKIEKDEV